MTVLDDTEIIFISRFMRRHMLNTNVIIGSRMPAYCTAPGMAILSRLPEDEAVAILERSDRKAYTPSTTWKLDDLVKKLSMSFIGAMHPSPQRSLRQTIVRKARSISLSRSRACRRRQSWSASRCTSSPERTPYRPPETIFVLLIRGRCPKDRRLFLDSGFSTILPFHKSYRIAIIMW